MIPMLILLLISFVSVSYLLYASVTSPIPIMNPKNLTVILLGITILLVVDFVGIIKSRKRRG